MTDLQDLSRQVGELTGKINAMDDHIKTMQQDVSDMKAQANRWKGAFLVILAFGGILGWVADKLWAALHRTPKGPF